MIFKQILKVMDKCSSGLNPKANLPKIKKPWMLENYLYKQNCIYNLNTHNNHDNRPGLSGFFIASLQRGLRYSFQALYTVFTYFIDVYP